MKCAAGVVTRDQVALYTSSHKSPRHAMIEKYYKNISEPSAVPSRHRLRTYPPYFFFFFIFFFFFFFLFGRRSLATTSIFRDNDMLPEAAAISIIFAFLPPTHRYACPCRLTRNIARESSYLETFSN